MAQSSRLPVRCGIVLAGGEGKRLQPFIHRVRADSLPKQYVNFIGSRSMLEHTTHRAEKIIPSDRLFTVVKRDHLRYPEVRRQIRCRPTGTVVVQPENKETGPGLFLPLMHLYKRYPESVVVVFPSDHFILEEDLFMAYVGMACHLVECDPGRLVLLGVEPDRAEPEYGYVLPDGHGNDLERLGLRKVRAFIEKPEPHTARELILRGGLWSTMVMVFRTNILLDLSRVVAPALYRSFEQIWEAIGTCRERRVVEAAYQRMKPVNFSTGLLQPLAREHCSSLFVLPVRGLRWCDWGSGRRVVSVLRETGFLGRLHGISEDRLFKIWGGLDSEDPHYLFDAD